jgi:hypoxanthine phosphoribosyltransferase
VSGGADSLALLVLATEAGCEVTAVHVDHGLRPGSAADADRVSEVAARVGATFRAELVPVPDGPNLEARARRARYAVLPADVLTGHTADDQAETVLLNLLRGAGLDGLAGYGPQRRPLSALRRHETHALCAALGLDPVHDPTNDDPRFRRNRVRHELVPLLDAIAERDVAVVLARQAVVLRSDAELLDELALAVDPADARELAAAPVALASRAVRRWLRTGHEQHPPDAATVARVLAVARGEAAGCDVGGGREVRRSHQKMVLGLARGYVAPVPSEPEHQHMWDSPDLGEVVVDAATLQARVAELGAAITADYAGRTPLLIGVLKGAATFMTDLARAIALPLEVDFMAVSSYGNATKTSGVVRIVKDLDLDLTGRDVIIVEDIVDSGLTLSYLRKTLAARGAASLEVCALLVREGLQKTEQDLRYVGFRIPPKFVVGYGLDVAEKYRNLPYVCVYDGDA